MFDINSTRLLGILIVFPPYVGDEVNPTLIRSDRWAQHPLQWFIKLYLYAQTADSEMADEFLERSETKAQVSFSLDPMLEHVEYPPPPFDKTLSHKIISNFCAKSNKTSIEEAGCGVCGQLVPTASAQLTRLKAVKNLLSVLQVPDVKRMQRKKKSEPVPLLS